MIVPAIEDIVLPDTEEVAEQRERRRHFDEEWSSISEVLASVPLEPMVVNISTKPEEDAETEQPSGPSVTRTTAEMAEEILEILNSRLKFHRLN